MDEDVRADFLRFIKFCVVGGVNTGVDFTVFYVLFTFAGLALIPSHAAGFACAVCTSYILNRNWAFKGRETRGWLSVFIFVSVSLLGFGIGTLSLLLLVKYGLSPVLAKVLSIGVTLIWNFCFYQGLVFRKRFSDVDEAQDVQ